MHHIPFYAIDVSYISCITLFIEMYKWYTNKIYGSYHLLFKTLL